MSVRHGAIVLALAVLQAPCIRAQEPDVERYAARRLEFTACPGYDATAVDLADSRMAKEADDLWAQGKRQESISSLAQMLKVYPLSLEGNLRMAVRSAQLADEAADEASREQLRQRSAEHRARYQLLVRSITRDTLCLRVEDHCGVIYVGEEYTVLRSMGWRSHQQALVSHDGVWYDVLTATADDGSVRKVYFDISPFFALPPRHQPAPTPVVSPPVVATASSAPVTGGGAVSSSSSAGPQER